MTADRPEPQPLTADQLAELGLLILAERIGDGLLVQPMPRHGGIAEVVVEGGQAIRGCFIACSPGEAERVLATVRKMAAVMPPGQLQ